MRPTMRDLEVRTIWRTAAEHCELVWSQFNGYRVRLWVRNSLVLEETLGTAEDGMRRGWELRNEWPVLVE